jgi:hypothetical protein
VPTTAHITKLEKANAQLCAELDATQTKLVEVEHRERALTFEYEDLKKILRVCILHMILW